MLNVTFVIYNNIMNILQRNFYDRDTLIVAKDLLGCRLCREVSGNLISGIIVETEAYKQNDPACHAYRGKTKRAVTLFKNPGIAYVYFIYGMHYCFNIVTESEGIAGAVLIRAIEPVGLDLNSNGPAKLCREFNITKELNEADLVSGKSGIWLESGDKITKDNIGISGRIGIKQAADYPWRFYIKDNKFVSKI